MKRVFKKRTLLALFLVTVLMAETLLLFPRSAAAIINEPLEPGIGAVNSVGWLDSRGLEPFFNGRAQQVYTNKKWKVYLNGKKSNVVGETVKFSLMDRSKPDSHMWGRNFVARSKYADWAKALNGEPSFVTKEAKKFEQRFYGFAGGSSFYRASLRHIAMLSGAEVVGYTNSDLTVNVSTTSKPKANISDVTQRLYPGDKYQVKISGSQFLPNIIWNEYTMYQTGSYELKLGNKTVDSGTFRTPFNKTVNLTADKAGRHTLTLTVTDGVGRSTTAQTQVVVYEKPGAPEPPYEPPSNPRPDPPGDIVIILPPIELPPKKPTADFYLPEEGYQKQEYPLRDQSYSPNGRIIKRVWTYTPNENIEVNYTDTPRNVSGREVYDHTIKFNKPGQYTVRLEIEDEKGQKDSTTRTINVKNKPPVADFSMPKRIMEGYEVEIVNESRDPDGVIVKNEWTWTPSDGILNVSDNMPVTMTDEGAKVWFSKPGTYKLKLKVTDNDGATDEYEREIVVESAKPKAAIEISGYLKQNRKITAKALVTTPDRFPIDDIEWVIKPNSLFMPDDVVKIKGTGNVVVL